MTATPAAPSPPSVPPAGVEPSAGGRDGALWFGFLGAPTAWGVQEIATYALVAHACFPRAESLAAPSAPSAWPAALVVTVAALVVSLATLWISMRMTRTTAGPPDGWGRTSAESHRATARHYLAFGGVLMSVTFALLIIYNGIALFGEPTCR